MALDLDAIIGIIDKLIKLLDEKKTKDERRKKLRVVNSRIGDVGTLLLFMNKLNAQLPPDQNEVKEIEKAEKIWKEFRAHLETFEEHHDENEDDKAKENLSKAKASLKEFREIVEKIIKRKERKLLKIGIIKEIREELEKEIRKQIEEELKKKQEEEKKKQNNR